MCCLPTAVCCFAHGYATVSNTRHRHWRLTAAAGHIPHPRLLQTYIALARIDPDAAWCQLNAALVAVSSGTGSTPADAVHAPRVPSGMRLQSGGQVLAFLPWQRISPPVLTASQPRSVRAEQSGGAATGSVVPQGLCECGGAKLTAMMRQVAQLPPRWHKQVESLLSRP